MGVTRSAMKIHWRGTVGGIVGGRQYGQDTWRSLADSVNQPNTQAQLEARARFSFVTKTVAALGYAYRLGYKMFIGDGKGPRALFAKQVSRDAVTGNMNDGYVLDNTKVLVSRGGLTQAYNTLAVVTTATQTVTVSWTDNSGVADAEATDKLCYLLYNSSKQDSVSGEDIATRADETADFNYPAAWAGDTLYLYIYWNGDAKGCSRSQCSGPYTA